MTRSAWALPLAACLLPALALGTPGLMPTPYTVRKRDTCPAIAKRFYGDERRIDLIEDAERRRVGQEHSEDEGERRQCLLAARQ